MRQRWAALPEYQRTRGALRFLAVCLRSQHNATHASAAESAVLKLYTEIWLPKLDSGAIALEKISVGGRPLQTTLNEDHEAMVFERGMELIMRVQPRLFDSITPPKIVSLFKLGEGTPPRLGIPTADVVDGFFSFLGFTRLVSEAPIRKAIARGIKECAFGYTTAPAPTLGLDRRFALAPSKVSFGTTVNENEIDLESGFLIVPQAIPQAAPTPGAAPTGPTPPGPVPPGQVPSGPVARGPTAPGLTPPAPGQPQKTVEFTVTADKDKVFAAWNAIANLAEMAGQVTLTVKAENPAGFDKGKLNNGVLEPLREADLS